MCALPYGDRIWGVGEAFRLPQKRPTFNGRPHRGARIIDSLFVRSKRTVGDAGPYKRIGDSDEVDPASASASAPLRGSTNLLASFLRDDTVNEKCEARNAKLRCEQHTSIESSRNAQNDFGRSMIAPTLYN